MFAGSLSSTMRRESRISEARRVMRSLSLDFLHGRDNFLLFIRKAYVCTRHVFESVGSKRETIFFSR